MAGSLSWQTVCDLTDKEAKDLYDKLHKNALCKWAELVGEDDDNYMQVLKSFDQTRLANTTYELFGNLIRR